MAWPNSLDGLSRPFRRGKGLVQAFRRQSCDSAGSRFKLQGLAPAARYAVTDLDEPGAARELTGSQLLQEGLTVVIRDKRGAALVTYRRVK